MKPRITHEHFPRHSSVKRKLRRVKERIATRVVTRRKVWTEVGILRVTARFGRGVWSGAFGEVSFDTGRDVGMEGGIWDWIRLDVFCEFPC